jgi:hypothetical protein
MFGGAGWLFADLMLALAVAFLVADTVRTPPPPSPPTAVQSGPAVHPRSPSPSPPTPSASPSGPALDFHDINYTLTVDPVGLQAGSASAEASVHAQVAGISRLTGRRVGLVLLFAGDPDPENLTEYDAAISLDQKMAKVLTGLSIHGELVFQVAVYRDFINYFSKPGKVQLNIYLFKQ